MQLKSHFVSLRSISMKAIIPFSRFVHLVSTIVRSLHPVFLRINPLSAMLITPKWSILYCLDINFVIASFVKRGIVFDSWSESVNMSSRWWGTKPVCLRVFPLLYKISGFNVFNVSFVKVS
ncbi:hypothetical protein Ancab_039810 [Ancistrocladus abbreviatus]